MDKQKFLNLIGDEKFIKKLISQKKPEDAQKLFKDEGFEFTQSEIRGIGEIIDNTAMKGAPLSEEEVEQVSGGVSFGTPLISAATAILSAILSNGSLEEKISMGVGGTVMGTLAGFAAGEAGKMVGSAIGQGKGSEWGDSIGSGIGIGVGVALGEGIGLSAYHRICQWMTERENKKRNIN